MGVISTGWMQVLILTPVGFGLQHGLLSCIRRANERGCVSSGELNVSVPYLAPYSIDMGLTSLL